MRCSILAIAFFQTAATPFLPGAEVTPEETFRASVWPTLEKSCVRCHGAEKQKGGLRLDSREATMKGGKEGPALVPGKPQESLLLKLVRHLDAEREMPPKENLLAAEIAALERWIAGGAPWPDLLGSSSTSSSVDGRIGDARSDSRNPIVKIFGGKRLDLWSLKPISNPAPPTVANAQWVRNPIDAFILARIEAAGERPAPEADRRKLARRLYFDLVGLPPTPEEIEAFVADPDPDAYTHLVDRLLDSPRHGEHWGRLWLDVVRYSDSEGFDWDEFRRQAWRYRDYVIRSLNADKPFNRFIREQLAGDEMVAGEPQSSDDQDCLIATGFLLLGPFDNSASKFGEALRARTQRMSDLVETTGSALLGLTLTCCRCHDHKYDPISQADYYRLRAFFEGVTSTDQLPIDLATKQDAIRRDNRVVQDQIARQQKILDDLSAPVIKRVHAQRLAALSTRDKDLLALPKGKVSPAQLKQINELNSSLDPDRTEIRDVLPRDQRAQFIAADKAIDVLEAQNLRSFTTALVGTEEATLPPPTHVLFQGDCSQAREVVSPGFLSVFDPNPAPIKPVARPKTSGRRTALAEWIVSERNPLTARVLVNRVWQGHFGEAIQGTPNDFGLAGARPSHPELLDWLAREFIQQGWSLKKLHRLIVTSATYRQGLSMAAEGKHLFACRVPHRLTAEAMRDSMLEVSGSLLPCDGGLPRWPELPDEIKRASPNLLDENLEKTKGWYPSLHEQLAVRSIYLVQKRNVQVPFLEVLDLPDNSLSCPRRNISTVAPQALTLLNSSLAAELAKSFARRIKLETRGQPVAAQVSRGFALALQRQPDPRELAVCLKFVEESSLAEFCRTLLNLNEFAYVD